MTPEQSFYQLCVCEIGIVLIGLVNVPVAAAIQILAPLIIFFGMIGHPLTYQSGLFIASFTLGTIVFSLLFLFFSNAFLPLLIITVFTLLTVAAVRIIENRMQRHFSGAL
jgi:hypothetical protein